jgi:iron complex outermembrane receptor protein
MRFSKSSRLAATVSLFALATTFAPGAALAQDAPAPAPETTEEADPTAASGDAATVEPQAAPAVVEEQDNTIVVTGSRIRRSEFTSPDPITIINPELGRQEGKIETVELINSAPIAAGSVQITSAISTNFVTNGGEGAQTVSLRGLGAERTLVLLNGRRAGPAGVRGGVTSFDLNTLPSSIVQSIEILKTGASSIYGSDAIAGVVNVLTKKETKGIELGGFVSVPTHGGGEVYNANVTWGKDFGRGHFLATFDYFRRKDLKRSDRKFLDCQEEFLTYTDGSRADIRDEFGDFACSGVLHNSILTNNDFSFIFGTDGLVVPDTFYPFDGFPEGEALFVSRFGGPELEGVCVNFADLPDPFVAAPPGFFGCNFDGPSTGALPQYSDIERGTDVISDLKRYTFYAEGAYELTDSVEVFGEFLYNKRKTYTDGISQVSTFQFTGSGLLPSLTRNPVTGGLSLNPAFPGIFCTPADFNCVVGDAGDPFNDEFAGNFLLRPLVAVGADSGTDIDYYRGVAGARGEFGNGFGWDVHTQYSRSEGEYFQDYTRADSIFTQDFRTRSCVGLETPVVGLPCMDIDWTDPRVLSGNFTPEERAFLFDRDVGNTLYKQLSGEATITGDLIDLAAGPLSFALGAHIRRDEIKDIPGEASQLGNRYNLTSAGVTAGHTLTKELFGELQLPVSRNKPFFQELTLSAAARITRVTAERADGVKDKFGDETWKLGFNWQVNDWLRFRGSWGTSFRAPALFELFLEGQTGFVAQQDIDVCSDRELALDRGTITQTMFDNCGAEGIPLDYEAATGGATVVQGGNIGELEPETSVAKTISMVLTPNFAFLPDTRVSLAVDYFDIEVKDEITQLGAGNIVIGCYNSDDFANEPLCDLITRVPEGGAEEFNIVQIDSPYINVSSQKNRGVDVTGRVTHDLGNLGRLSLLAQMTWQLEDKLDLFGNDTSIVELNGTVGDPRWVGDFNLTWANGPWTVTYGLDVIGSADNKDDLRDDQGAALDENDCRTSAFRPGVPPEEAAAGGRVRFCPDVSVPKIAYHSLSVTRRIGEEFEFSLGMANIFDKKPPRVSTVFNGGIAVLGQVPVFGSQYDYLGRRVFASVRGRF